jgi:hypothetical protein
MGPKGVMMIKIEFTDAVDDGRHWIVHRRITRTENGGEPVVEEGIHVFPHDALEWRAAEYGIDPSDVDTLMDIVLAEPYITSEDYEPGTTLYDAPSIQDAREAHLSRCAKVKLVHRMSTRGKNQPHVQRVKDNALMHPEAVEIKRDLVTQGREMIRHHNTVRVADPHTERLARLREERDGFRRDTNQRRDSR